MNIEKVVFIIIVFFLIVGCGAKQFRQIESNDLNDIYLIGTYEIGPFPLDCLFLLKNGEYAHLESGDPWLRSRAEIGSANSIFVSGQDVYVAGWRKLDNITYASYWKNGKLKDLKTYADAKSIFIDQNDIYVSGHTIDIKKSGASFKDDGPLWHGNIQSACYWKNKRIVDLGYGSANSIVVDSGNIYVAGYYYISKDKVDGVISRSGGVLNEVVDRKIKPYENEWFTLDFLSNHVAKACFWKNNELVDLNKMNQIGEATSIYVSNDDIYISGWVRYISSSKNYNNKEIANAIIPTACYWKNEEYIDLGFGKAYSVFVDNENVYVAGINGNGHACYWKNENIVDLNKEGVAYSIQVVGKDIYIAGSADGNTCYWKNGNIFDIGKSGSINDIFVVKK